MAAAVAHPSNAADHLFGYGATIPSQTLPELPCVSSHQDCNRSEYATFWNGCRDLALKKWQQVIVCGSVCGQHDFESIVALKMPEGYCEEDVYELFRKVDLDGDGEVSRNEFLVWVVGEVPEEKELFQECLSARMTVSFAIAGRICSSADLENRFSSLTHVPLEPGALIWHTACAGVEVPDEIPDLPLRSEGLEISINADVCGSTSMIAWALCPLLTLENRLKVLNAVAAADCAWDFAALLSVAALRLHETSGSSDVVSSLVAAALDALPPVVGKHGRLAQESVMQAAAVSLMERSAPFSLEFGMMLGFPELKTSVKAAAPACLARVLRFYKGKDLAARYPADLPSNHGLVLNGILASLPEESLSYVADKRRIAEIVYIAIREGDEEVAESLVASTAVLLDDVPARRLARVHALSHVFASFPRQKQAREALVACLADPDEEVRRASSHCLISETHKGNSGCEANVPLLLQSLRKCQTEKLQLESQGHIMGVAAATASRLERLSSQAELGEMALLTLREVPFSEATLQALQVLTHLGPFAPEGAVLAVSSLLEEWHGPGCLQACQALTSMVQQGNIEAVARVSQALKDFQGPPAERVQLANCLARLATIGGDQVASEAFLNMLASFPEKDSKAAALWCLESSALPGDKSVRSRALSELDSLSAEVLKASAAALKKVCHVGDMEAARPLLKLLATDASAKNPEVVTAIMNSLVEICPPADPLVLAELSHHLSSGSWPIRMIALQSIQALAPASSNSTEAKSAVLQCLKREVHPDVLSCAVEVIASVACPGDSEVLEILTALKEEDPAAPLEVALEEALEALSGDTLLQPEPIMMWAGETTGAVVASEVSFQLVDGTSTSSFHVVDGAASQTSFQIVDGPGQPSFDVLSDSDCSFAILPSSASAALAA